MRILCALKCDWPRASASLARNGSKKKKKNNKPVSRASKSRPGRGNVRANDDFYRRETVADNDNRDENLIERELTGDGNR